MLPLLVLAMPAWGATDPWIENLALCRGSWLEWKSTAPSKLESFSAFLRSNFAHSGDDTFFTPKSAMTLDGLKVTRVFPESIGMGLGFSVLVDASFDVARQVLEHELGTPLRDCTISEGMRTCELSIAEQRTVMLVSNYPPYDKTSLAGCYYFYEK